MYSENFTDFMLDKRTYYWALVIIIPEKAM